MKSAAVGDMNEAALGECAMSHIVITNACPLHKVLMENQYFKQFNKLHHMLVLKVAAL